LQGEGRRTERRDHGLRHLRSCDLAGRRQRRERVLRVRHFALPRALCSERAARDRYPADVRRGRAGPVVFHPADRPHERCDLQGRAWLRSHADPAAAQSYVRGLRDQHGGYAADGPDPGIRQSRKIAGGQNNLTCTALLASFEAVASTTFSTCENLARSVFSTSLRSVESVSAETNATVPDGSRFSSESSVKSV